MPLFIEEIARLNVVDLASSGANPQTLKKYSNTGQHSYVLNRVNIC